MATLKRWNATTQKWELLNLTGGDIGDLNLLNTEDKSSIVGAVNETVDNLNSYAKKQQENWILSTLTNEWVNYGAPFGTVSYYKDEFGIVHLRGMMKDGKAGWEALRLAVNYRPAHEKSFIVASNATNAKININPNGFLIPVDGGSGVWVSLDGVSFRV